MSDLVEITLRYNLDDLYDAEGEDLTEHGQGEGDVDGGGTGAQPRRPKLKMSMGTLGEPPGAAQVSPDDEDETRRPYEELFDGDVVCDMEPIPGTPGHFRVPEALSMTPFGPAGPTLGLGDVIEAVPLNDGSYQLVQVLETASRWSKTIAPVSDQAWQEPPINELLSEFSRIGGAWEYSAGNLTVQFPRQPDETGPPAEVQDLVHRIEAATSGQ